MHTEGNSMMCFSKKKKKELPCDPEIPKWAAKKSLHTQADSSVIHNNETWR